MFYTWLMALFFAAQILGMPSEDVSCGAKMANARPRTAPWTREQINRATPQAIKVETDSFGVLLRFAKYGANATAEQVNELAAFLETPFCWDFETRSRSRNEIYLQGRSESMAYSNGAPEFVLVALHHHLEFNREASPHRAIDAIMHWLEFAIPYGGDFNYLSIFHLICKIVLRDGHERLAEFFWALARSQLTPYLLNSERALPILENLLRAAGEAPPKLRPKVESVSSVRDAIGETALRSAEAPSLIQEMNLFFVRNGRPSWTMTLAR